LSSTSAQPKKIWRIFTIVLPLIQASKFDTWIWTKNDVFFCHSLRVTDVDVIPMAAASGALVAARQMLLGRGVVATISSVQSSTALPHLYINRQFRRFLTTVCTILPLWCFDWIWASPACHACWCCVAAVFQSSFCCKLANFGVDYNSGVWVMGSCNGAWMIGSNPMRCT
jgi:hypothetical protein